MKRSRASDKLQELRKRLSPEELEEALGEPTEEGMKFFRDLLEEKKGIGAKLRETKAGAKQVALAREFYNDLVQDGFIKVDYRLFSQSKLKDAYETDQSHEGLAEHFEKVESRDFHESTLAMALIYRLNFENIFKEFLRPIACKIAGRDVESNGKALEFLMEYREGRFQDLFKSLIPTIRNSVDHSSFFIDDKHQTVEFRDRKKSPLVVGYEVFRGIFMESFMLKLSISTAAFELVEPLASDTLRKQEAVVEFVKKHHLRLVPDKSGPSIYDIGRFLEMYKRAKP